MADFSNLIVSHVREFNNDTGATYTITYEGTLAELEVVREYWELNGVGAPIGYGNRTTTTQRPGLRQLTVRVPDSILYTTRWECRAEARDVPIIWSEDVRSFLGRDSLDLSTVAGLNTWLEDVRNLYGMSAAIKSGKVNLSSWNYKDAVEENPKLMDVAFMMVRDGEYFQWRTPVLSRVRLIPFISSDRVSLVGRTPLYTTEGLVTEMDLDVATYNRVSSIEASLPAAYPNTVWAWKMRDDQFATVIGSGKVEERRDFAFGRWSTITHQLIV